MMTNAQKQIQFRKWCTRGIRIRFNTRNRRVIYARGCGRRPGLAKGSCVATSLHIAGYVGSVYLRLGVCARSASIYLYSLPCRYSSALVGWLVGWSVGRPVQRVTTNYADKLCYIRLILIIRCGRCCVIGFGCWIESRALIR